jgi:hypothetical protein
MLYSRAEHFRKPFIPIRKVFAYREKKMTRKILSGLILFVIAMNLCALGFAQAQPQTLQKDVYTRAPPLKPGPPSGGGKPPGSGGIATGVVSNPPPPSDRWAVIIGISDYAGDANDLDYCDDDARDFYNALVNVYGWYADHIKMLIDSQATKANILAAIDWMRTNEGPGDQVIFFYSGHGTTSTSDVDNDGERKDECIIPWECTSEYFIWDGNLKVAFSAFESTRILFYFDSCYSGGMTDLAGSGRLICMACKETRLSLESSSWENGQFTYYFVDQGMLAGKADKNNDGLVTCEEAFDYALANCSQQTPTASDNFENDMLL